MQMRDAGSSLAEKIRRSDGSFKFSNSYAATEYGVRLDRYLPIGTYLVGT